MFANENNIEERIQELPNDLKKKKSLIMWNFYSINIKVRISKKQIVSNLTGKADYLTQT